MIPLGIMIGLTVRMGHVIAHNVKRAKLLASWCMLFTTMLGAVVALLLYQFRIQIAMLFSNDDEVIQGCKDIWLKLCIYIFILYIFGINRCVIIDLLFAVTSSSSSQTKASPDRPLSNFHFLSSAILRALGMQWQMAAIIFGCLWLMTLPAILYFAVRKGGGIGKSLLFFAFDITFCEKSCPFRHQRHPLFLISL